jgi:biotin carboxyl carrier protein
MPLPALPVLILTLAAAVTPAERPAERETRIVTKDVKGLGIRVDTTWAQPGGLIVATVRPAKAIGPASFVLEGRRCPVYSGPGGLRALVPVPLTMLSGPTTLGLEIRGGRGRRRIPIEIEIAPQQFAQRARAIPPEKKDLLERPERVRDSRLVLGAIRLETPLSIARGHLQPPVDAAPEPFFGAQETYDGATFVSILTDGLYGDHHRGLDYAVPAGTAVRAPAAGTVVLAQPLAFAGQALVIDHGRGVISVFFHLSRIGVAVGDRVEPGATLGASGDSGLTPVAHLHWGVYVHGEAVDPRVFEHIELG